MTRLSSFAFPDRANPLLTCRLFAAPRGRLLASEQLLVIMLNKGSLNQGCTGAAPVWGLPTHSADLCRGSSPGASWGVTVPWGDGDVESEVHAGRGLSRTCGAGKGGQTLLPEDGALTFPGRSAAPAVRAPLTWYSHQASISRH